MARDTESAPFTCKDFVRELSSMLIEPEIQLRLSIWRPASLNGTYLHGLDDESNRGDYSPLDQSKLLEQIYVWDSGPNDVLGTAMPEIGERIRSDLLARFASERSPSERSVLLFQQTLEKLLGEPDLQCTTHWSDCRETVMTVNGDTLNLRASMIPAVLRHFLWVARSFGQIPKASVLIR